MNLGIDIGSQNIYWTVIDKKSIVKSGSIAHAGNINGSLIRIIEELKEYLNHDSKFGITGSVDISGIRTIDSILSGVEANRFLGTGCNYILSVGCERYYLITLDDNGNYVEHTSNPICASGTGSFIDQQAERIGITTAKLSEIADGFKGKTPTIATRCAVFAKSDIIHAQAKGYSKESIVTGLCEGMSHSIIDNLLKSKDITGNILFIGGVSRNAKIRAEIEKTINRNLFTIEESAIFNSVGAAILADQKAADFKSIIAGINKKREKRPPVSLENDNYPDFDSDKMEVINGVEIFYYENTDAPAYDIHLGIDIGSTSTKMVAFSNNKIITGFYTRTAGEPLKAVKKIFDEFNKVFEGKKINILGTGTTGSGRKLIKTVLNTDIELNEITAHANGAVFIDPKVDTIFEIGGQDSKYTFLRDGQVVNSAMNFVCAAGTGSFIEEQAKRLNITLDEISSMAENSSAPYTSDRCTVYMERDLNIYMSEGFSKNEIITGVLHSVRDNYLSKVVGKSQIGNRIFFQGATARNRALVSVFRNDLNKDIIVSKYCHLTGALGVCIELQKKGFKKSLFSGTDFTFTEAYEVCSLCTNRCDITIYDVNGKKSGWGYKCGREYDDKKFVKHDTRSDLEKSYFDVFNIKGLVNKYKGAKTIGIPYTLYITEYFYLFAEMFSELGYNIKLLFSNEHIVKAGKKLINSDFCLPMIATHGLVSTLASMNTDYIFFPAFINGDAPLTEPDDHDELFYNKVRDAYYCYYSEYAPTVVNNLRSLSIKDKLISPKMKFYNKTADEIGEYLSDYLSNGFGFDKDSTKKAFIKGYDLFDKGRKSWLNYGLNKANSKKPKILLIGRPYAILEPHINLGLPARFEELGYEVIYQSMIDEQDKPVSGRLGQKMHWYYGREIINGINYAINQPDVFPVFLSCFRCSPDAYLISYLKEIMEKNKRPYLIMQLDEHSNDAGYMTRIEAASDTFINYLNSDNKTRVVVKEPDYKNSPMTKDLNILMPYLGPVISELQTAVYNSFGYKAFLMPLDQKMILSGSKFTTGGECLPNAAIIGSIIDILTKNKLDPAKTIVYMPTVCMGCNFNQYSILIELALEKAGYGDIKISNANTLRQHDELPKELNVNLLDVNILGSILLKLYYRYRANESVKGDTEKALAQTFEIIKEELKTGKPLTSCAIKIKELFGSIKLKDTKRPRIAVIGDLYSKYNTVLNQDIYTMIEDLGGEVRIPSFTETVLHFLDADSRENGLDSKYKRGLVLFEKRYERIFSDLLPDDNEPSQDECADLIKENGIEHYIAGETTMNLGRALHYIKHKRADAIVHLNPVFCCPGVVSAAIFRKIQHDTGFPIIDLFYDGNNKPNSQIIPQMHYLNQKISGGTT